MIVSILVLGKDFSKKYLKFKEKNCVTKIFQYYEFLFPVFLNDTLMFSNISLSSYKKSNRYILRIL